jgi:hypothetical protein
MSNFSNTVFTYTLINSNLLIKSEYGIRSISLKLISGTASFIGTMKVGTLNSVAIPLIINEPVTITGETIIDGLNILASSGQVQIIAKK